MGIASLHPSYGLYPPIGHSILNARTREQNNLDRTNTFTALSQIANASHAARRRTAVEIATCARQCADALRSNFCRHANRMVNPQAIVLTSARRRLQTALEGRVRVLFHKRYVTMPVQSVLLGPAAGYTSVQL